MESGERKSEEEGAGARCTDLRPCPATRPHGARRPVPRPGGSTHRARARLGRRRALTVHPTGFAGERPSSPPDAVSRPADGTMGRFSCYLVLFQKQIF